MLTEEQNKNFGEEFVTRYLSHGFATMTKTEIDTLVFHLISESEDLKGKTNYHIANKLKITESKVKSLRLNSSLKYRQANHKSVLGNIVTRITEEMDKPDFEKGIVTITIENPVEQRELAHAIKSVGRNIEYGLNKELFKISPIALFEIVVRNLENPESAFRDIIQSNIQDSEKENEIINNTLTFRQKFNKVGEEITDKASLISLLGAASGALS